MMNDKYIINHVMSRETESGIFSSIFDYYKKYSPIWIEHVESIRPIEGADVYHYHRPQLESVLVKNAFCTVHHDLNDTDPWHSRHHFIPRYNEAAAVICLNETQKQILSIEEDLPIGKLFVVPHGYNHELLSLKAPRSGNGEKFTLGIASRRYGRRVKGEAYLHELIKRLDPSLIKFILVGQDRSLDAIDMRQLGFEVEVFERLPYRVFQGFYGAIDCLLMCSGHEGGPANVPESLATGTPVLTSRVGMSIDFIISGDNGHFLELNPDEDANVIHHLAASSQVYASMEATCRSLAAELPTWKDSIEENLKVYGQIAGFDLKNPPTIVTASVFDTAEPQA
jgi:glycosyltransferase involved in cell wall biosynthesis